jgi:hypothetical protein
MIARDPRAQWRYVLQADRKLPTDEQTVFLLSHLTLTQEAQTVDALARGEIGTHRTRNLREHLVGWENMRDPKGAQLAFEVDPRTKLVRDDLLMVMHVADRQELAMAVENETVYDPADLGKSVPPST